MRAAHSCFSCRKYQISDALLLFVCSAHLEDLAEPGVEVVCVWRHSALQIWRLEGDVLEGKGWRDRVENLEKTKVEAKNFFLLHGEENNV